MANENDSPTTVSFADAPRVVSGRVSLLRWALKPSGELTLQGGYEWSSLSQGGIEWRDIEVVELPEPASCVGK